MANQEHLTILKQGVKHWNEWREKNLQVQPDLAEANLWGAHLAEANLNRANLYQANLLGAHLSEANLNGANLLQADLLGGHFDKAQLKGASLVEAHLDRAHLNWADLSGADLTGASLTRANLYRAKLHLAVLIGAELTAANLSMADLSEANLEEADLSGANLDQAIVRGANFKGALIGATIFANLDLSQARALETAVHNSPSTVGIDTIYRSGGSIVEAFLRGCGVPDTMISFGQSLVIKPTPFYSTYITHSISDEDFARKLHDDLRTRALRVWLSPQDVENLDKPGKAIDHTLQPEDKLIVVLSQHSLQSTWLMREIEAALALERQHNLHVLNLVRLDDSIEDNELEWLKEIQDDRTEVSFENWKDPSSYRVAFEGLLRTLDRNKSDA